jgi:hypothetical protein
MMARAHLSRQSGLLAYGCFKSLASLGHETLEMPQSFGFGDHRRCFPCNLLHGFAACMAWSEMYKAMHFGGRLQCHPACVLLVDRQARYPSDEQTAVQLPLDLCVSASA